MRKHLKLYSLKMKILNSALIAVAFILIFAGPAPASIISSQELVENDHFYDGKTVTFQGEAIGDVMVRGDYAWIHLNDDPYAESPSKLAGYNSGMAVWCKADNAAYINFVGNYKNKGDIVEITGVFNKSCAKHSGDMDIHASYIKIIKPGYPIEHKFQTNKLWWAVILGFAAAVFFAVNKFWRLK
ncbi:hypothetical protein [Candidatus Oleimmundimicrobium sp.]|uniref:hypothetical protein n=1 Tax=Candidatus Oleimmundimicrobium sp. TaxID=3060597 RepID=UPI0027260456|nr:hypothetical protein [Candidatus Oleimmundimicrobium sp.]MDO8886846.1 hypothetical protein [Candidatus Oleimmundimicrobium sp.]